MSQHICDKCHKDLKYLSLLQRHQTKLKPCTPDTYIYHDDTKNIEDNNLLTKFQDNINKAKTLQDTKEIINELTTYFNTNNTQTTGPTQTLQHMCSTCNHNFYDKQTLRRHVKNNKCKGITLPQVTNNINNTTNNTTNNITNNNITNNTNNNITININPFKCESLSHITLANFKTIYKSIYNIDALLCYFIYKRNQNNISFFKNNINKNIVSVLNNKMEIEKMTDAQFIKALKTNITESNIELFYNFKDDLTHTEILKYMKNMILYNNDFTNNELAKKEYTNALTSLLDTSFRDKDKKNLINYIITQLTLDTDAKQILKKHNYNIIKTKIKKIKEYYDTPIETVDTVDTKNLHTLKTTINDTIDSELRLIHASTVPATLQVATD